MSPLPCDGNLGDLGVLRDGRGHVKSREIVPRGSGVAAGRAWAICSRSLDDRRQQARYCSGRCRAEASLRRRIESAVRHAGERKGRSST